MPEQSENAKATAPPASIRERYAELRAEFEWMAEHLEGVTEEVQSIEAKLDALAEELGIPPEETE
jgi:hypothetical protein